MYRKFLAALLAVSGIALGSTAGLAETPAGGDPAKGEKVFRKCAACHTVDQGGRAKAGPNLWGVLGADVAASPAYGKYSKAIRAYGGTWSAERLDKFLASPRKAVPGTRMAFAGLKKEADRINLIAYLNSKSDQPSVLPWGTAAPQSVQTPQENEFGLLFVDKGVEETFYACTPCHSERIVAQQGLTRESWDELIDWMVEEQDMEEPEQLLRDQILDYLARHYNTDRPHRPVN